MVIIEGNLAKLYFQVFLNLDYAQHSTKVAPSSLITASLFNNHYKILTI